MSRLALHTGAARRRRDDPRAGQALVEFALVVPLLLLLLLGIVEFARAWNVHQVLTDAAREGARETVVDNGKTEAEVKQIIIEAAGRGAIPLTVGDITITGLNGGKGTPATVQIVYDHQLRWVGALMRLATGDRTVTMVSTFVMRNE